MFGRCPGMGWEPGGHTLAGGRAAPGLPLWLGLAPRSEGPGPCQVGKESPAAPLCAHPVPSGFTVLVAGRDPPARSATTHTASPAATPAAAGPPAPDWAAITARSDGGEDAQREPQRPAVPDTRRDQQQAADSPRAGRGRAWTGPASGRRRAGCHQVGVCLGASPRGPQGGVGGGGGGVGGRVAAAGPVGVGRGGDGPPRGADLLIGQVGAGRQPQRRRTGPGWSSDGPPGRTRRPAPPAQPAARAGVLLPARRAG